MYFPLFTKQHFLKQLTLKRCSLFIALSISPFSIAADYQNFVNMPHGMNDALSFDSKGNLYVSHSGNFSSTGLKGSSVFKVSPNGEISSILEGFNGPLGHKFDSKGNMYIANYNTGTIDIIDTKGKKSVFADIGNAGFASGIAINSKDEIFVASYSGNLIYKLDTTGVSEVWLKNRAFNGPVGITIDEKENLYVGNYNDGRIFKIEANQKVTELSKSPDAAGYITYISGNIYATGINTNKIYQIPVSGAQAKELAGSAEAGFNFPNGITTNNDGTKIYVSNYKNNKIVTIENFN